MANAPEQRLSLLKPSAFQERLRDALTAVYGVWHRADDTGLAPDDWFAVLADAVQAEALNWDDALALCQFALCDSQSDQPTGWAVDVLGRAHAQVVLEAALSALRPEKLGSPQAAKDLFQELRHQLRDSHGLRGREVMDVLRAALTGEQRGPCLGIVGALLGPVRTRRRLEEQSDV